MTESIIQFPLLIGIFAATIHVLSGPDHLAAVAPIALNTKFRPWMIGMSWGIGHLVGMLALGMLFFFFKEFIPTELISANSEKLVGILLIVIGLWSLFRLYKHTRNIKHEHVHTHKDDEGNAFVHRHHHDHGHTKVHAHAHLEFEKQTYLAAMGIGILHGLAGFSHILHLLPTLAFPSRLDSILYLSGFGAGTILAMVAFSFILGLVAQYSSQQKKDLVFNAVNSFAGFAAIFIGLFWLFNTW